MQSQFPTSKLPPPSEHLSWKEVHCHNGVPYPVEWRSSRLVALAQEFERIRHACGDQPIAVLSGFRTPAWNTTIGGAQTSQHCEGRALDLRPPADWTVPDFHARIVRMIREQPDSLIRGVGRYPTFVHIDIRPGPRVYRWSGQRKAADQGRWFVKHPTWKELTNRPWQRGDV